MKPALAILAAVMLSGCASELLSSGNIRDKTAEVLGMPAASISIAGRHSDGVTSTLYTARTPTGAYSCVIKGGSFLSLGSTDSPTCTPSGPRKTPRS